MKRILYILAASLATLTVLWLAAAMLGSSKLRSQIVAKYQKQIDWSNRTKADPHPPEQGMPSIEVQLLRVPLPLYFYARTSARGRFSNWDNSGRYRDENIATVEYGVETTASYIYTPWRAYEIKVVEQSEFKKPELSPYEFALKKAEEDAATKGRSPNKAPQTTAITPPSSATPLAPLSGL